MYSTCAADLCNQQSSDKGCDFQFGTICKFSVKDRKSSPDLDKNVKIQVIGHAESIFHTCMYAIECMYMYVCMRSKQRSLLYQGAHGFPSLVQPIVFFLLTQYGTPFYFKFKTPNSNLSLLEKNRVGKSFNHHVVKVFVVLINKKVCHIALRIKHDRLYGMHHMRSHATQLGHGVPTGCFFCASYISWISHIRCVQVGQLNLIRKRPLHFAILCGIGFQP